MNAADDTAPMNETSMLEDPTLDPILGRMREIAAKLIEVGTARTR